MELHCRDKLCAGDDSKECESDPTGATHVFHLSVMCIYAHTCIHICLSGEPESKKQRCMDTRDSSGGGSTSVGDGSTSSHTPVSVGSSPCDHSLYYEGGYSQWREEPEYEGRWEEWDWPPADWRPRPWHQAYWDSTNPSTGTTPMTTSRATSTIHQIGPLRSGDRLLLLLHPYRVKSQSLQVSWLIWRVR